MDFYVYIIRSLKDNRSYVGFTVDLERRLLEHNNGNTKSTRPFRPWKMIYSECYDNRSDAYKREWHLKHSEGRKEKLDLIQKFGGIA